MSRKIRLLQKRSHVNMMAGNKIPERIKLLIESKIEETRKLKRPLSKYQKKILKKEISLHKK
ncbi:MAG: hypothetical protein PHP82_02230 [Candidatus ainarchaeum sp.]|nr:hypothetical protein [Candidatus ainarchaeum sp.]